MYVESVHLLFERAPSKSSIRNGEQRLRSRHNNRADQTLLIVKCDRLLI